MEIEDQDFLYEFDVSHSSNDSEDTDGSSRSTLSASLGSMDSDFEFDSSNPRHHQVNLDDHAIEVQEECVVDAVLRPDSPGWSDSDSTAIPESEYSEDSDSSSVASEDGGTDDLDRLIELFVRLNESLGLLFTEAQRDDFLTRLDTLVHNHRNRKKD